MFFKLLQHGPKMLAASFAFWLRDVRKIEKLPTDDDEMIALVTEWSAWAKGGGSFPGGQQIIDMVAAAIGGDATPDEEPLDQERSGQGGG